VTVRGRRGHRVLRRSKRGAYAGENILQIIKHEIYRSETVELEICLVADRWRELWRNSCPFEGVSTGRKRQKAMSDRGYSGKGSSTNIFIGRKNRAVTEHRPRRETGLNAGYCRSLSVTKKIAEKSIISLSGQRELAS